MIILSNCLIDTADEGSLKVANSLIKRIKNAVPENCAAEIVLPDAADHVWCPLGGSARIQEKKVILEGNPMYVIIQKGKN